MINNFHYLRGGDCRYTFDLAKLLNKNNHEIAFFSMQHPKNLSSEYDQYFISNINYQEINNRTLGNVGKAISKSFWNLEAQEMLRSLLKRFQPDIAHVQNILHHITPSIFPILKEFLIPIVHTLHDYNLICPDIYLYRDGIICEECFRGRYFRAVFHKCKRDSFSASILAAGQRYIHSLFDAYKHVSYFIAPTQFTKRIFINSGFGHSDRIMYVPHFIDYAEFGSVWSPSTKNEIVFAGRLIKEKGVNTLIEAAEHIPEVDIVIFGDGELHPVIKEEIRLRKLQNVRLMGWRSREEVLEALRDAKALVMPSEWYETTGLTVLEASAMFRPSVVSSGTAMAEVIINEENGLHFPMGNSYKLAQSLKRIILDQSLAESLGKAARSRIEKIYNPESHYKSITDIYRKAFTTLRS